MRHLQTALLIIAIVSSSRGAMAGIVQTQSIQINAKSLADMLLIYAQVTDRTILHGSLPQISLNLETTVTNKNQAAKLIEQTLMRKKIAMINDGKKFVIVVPESRRNEAMAILKANPLPDGEKGGKIQNGAINMPQVSLIDAMRVYAHLKGGTGVEQNPAFPVPPLQISLLTQSALTHQEAVHAFDVVFALNGVKMVPGANGSWKLAPFVLSNN